MLERSACICLDQQYATIMWWGPCLYASIQHTEANQRSRVSNTKWSEWLQYCVAEQAYKKRENENKTTIICLEPYVYSRSQRITEHLYWIFSVHDSWCRASKISAWVGPGTWLPSYLQAWVDEQHDEPEVPQPESVGTPLKSLSWQALFKWIKPQHVKPRNILTAFWCFLCRLMLAMLFHIVFCCVSMRSW